MTGRSLEFGIPSALTSRFSLVLNEAEAAVECPTAVSFRTFADGPRTRVEAVMGAGDRVLLAWTPRIKRADEIAVTVFCRNASMVSVGGGYLGIYSQLDYQVTQGELRGLRVRLPKEHRLLRVTGESIRGWKTSRDETGEVLSVDLAKGVSANYRLIVETEQAIEGLAGAVTVAVPHAELVKRETGLLALKGSEELGVSVETVEGLQKTDVSEIAAVLGHAGQPAMAYQFLTPGFRLGVRIETLQPRLEARVRNHIEVGLDCVRLRSRIDYTIQRAGVFSVRLGIPSGFEVESVTGDAISSWVERKGAFGSGIEATLKQRTLGACPIEVRLVRWHASLPGSVELTGIRPLEVATYGGFVVVASEPGVELRPAQVDGLTEVPLSAAGLDQIERSPGKPGAGLAYKFGTSDAPADGDLWKLVMTANEVAPWIRAEVVNWLTLGEGTLNGRATIRFDIQNAPAREFRFRVPAGFRNVEVTGADIRRRDPGVEEWRVELQNRVMGEYQLALTWDQAWETSEGPATNRLQVAGIGVIGVERETGTLGVAVDARWEVIPETTSSELVRIDASEIPEWAGAAPGNAVLAYRYLRPGYGLSLAARRFSPAEVLQALVDEARLTTVVADDGQMITELAMAVRNNGRQFIEINLPAGARVWSAFVGGQAVKPSLHEGRLLLPLERTSDLALAVEVIYVGGARFPRNKGAVELESPALDLPVKNARWELYLPPDYDYRAFGGTMARELGAAPVYRTFTLGEYSQAEQEFRRAREIAAVSSAGEVRRKLADGRLDEAAKAFNAARRYDVREESVELKELEKDLRKAQSSNLVNAQQEAIESHRGAGPGGGESAGRQLAEWFDGRAAEEQWVKLQRAQEVAAGAVQPLRVNLPTRGMRQSFSQVLQTEAGKPMSIRFTAVNAKVPDWFARLAVGGLGFLALWWLANLVLARRKAGVEV